MKFIITGLHDSGKEECAQILEDEFNISIGKIFTNDQMSSLEEMLSIKEMNSLFNSGAYMFYKKKNFTSGPFTIYESLSQEVWDSKSVFVLSPDQVAYIGFNKFSDDIVWIWLDSDLEMRKLRYSDMNRIFKYSFYEKEKYEREYDYIFLDKICLNKYLYFNNEDPTRIATIIYTLYKFPELIDLYTKYFT